MSLNIHTDIVNKLNYFIEINKIPNIIFHGTNGTGKKKIVENFINNIYNNNINIIRENTMYVNCAHGKGIKFIRDELKLYAKTNINIKNGLYFKSIILSNADKLTIDAQSALRRCIELFTYNTRFFIIVDDKYKLLRPILSRFSEIHIPEPIIKSNTINLYNYDIDESFSINKINNLKYTYLSNIFKKSYKNLNDVIILIEKLYKKSYSALDLINYFEKKELDSYDKFELIFSFHKMKKEFRNEKILMLFIVNYILFRSIDTLENISFM